MHRKIIFAAVVGLALGFVAVGSAQRAARGGKAEPRILETADGHFVRGWATTDREGKSTFTDMNGETTEVPPAAKLHTLREMENEYQQVQRSIMVQDLKDYDRYAKLIDWAKQHGLYQEAAEAAERMLRLNPANPDPTAEKELKWAREMMAAAKAGPAAKNRNTWTMEDVQKVRFALLPTSRPAENYQVRFKGKAVQQFLKEMAQKGKYDTPEKVRQFLSRPATEQAAVIKRETRNQFQPEIIIGRNPPAIAEYQRVVQPILARTCGNINCHGSGDLNFKLLPRAVTVPELYANYYSLDTYRAKGGDLISHDQPEESLFLSFLLPKDAVPEGRAHPKSITPPPARTKKDARYQQVLKWIKGLPPCRSTRPSTRAKSTTRPAEAPGEAPTDNATTPRGGA